MKGGRGGSGRDWDPRTRVAKAGEIERERAHRVRSILSAAQRGSPRKARAEALSRPGPTFPLAHPTRYARTSNANEWVHAQPGGFIGAILDAVSDGRDRIILAWPSRPDNGFVAAALALREARATGRLCTLHWPCGHGAQELLTRPALYSFTPTTSPQPQEGPSLNYETTPLGPMLDSSTRRCA